MGSWLKSCLRWKWKSPPPDQICICIWGQVRVGLGWGGCGPGAYAISVVRRWATIAALYLYSSSKAQREELGEWPWMERCGGGWLEPWEEECNSEWNASCLWGWNQEGRKTRWLKSQVTRGHVMACAPVSELGDRRSCWATLWRGFKCMCGVCHRIFQSLAETKSKNVAVEGHWECWRHGI